MLRKTVAQPVKRSRQLVAPAAQRGALGYEVVRTAQPGVLEHRKQYVIGVSCRRAAEVGLLRQCRFKRGCDDAKFGEPAWPVGTIFLQCAAEGGFPRSAAVLAVFRRQAKDEIGRNQSPDNRTKRFRRPVVDEACESTPGLPAKQRRAVGKPGLRDSRQCSRNRESPGRRRRGSVPCADHSRLGSSRHRRSGRDGIRLIRPYARGRSGCARKTGLACGRRGRRAHP